MSSQPEPWIVAQRLQTGTRLRILREWRGLSQEDLGHAANTSPSSVWRAEKGLVSLKLDQLAWYARELRVPLAWFFTDDPLPVGDPTTGGGAGGGGGAEAAP